MALLYTVFLTVILLSLLYRYITEKFLYWEKRNVPYIKPTSPFGNMYPVLTLKKPMGHWLQEQYEKFDYDYFGIFAFTQPIFVIRSPQIIKDIMIKHFSYFDERTTVLNENDEVMSNLLFTKPNPGWKKIRAKMTPVFSSGKLNLMFPLVLEEAQYVVDILRRRCCSGPVEIKEICSKYSINVIAKCAFAVDAKTFDGERSEFSLENRLRFFVARFLPRLAKSCNIYLINPKVSQTMRNIFTTVLYARKQSANSKKNDLIDILLSLKNSDTCQEFSEVELIGAAVNFFAAGFETVGSTMAFILYELCLAPDIQTRLRNELNFILDEHNGKLTYDGIKNMKYMDKVISEGLRKYPVLPFLDRKCKADFKIPGTEVVIEKGTAVYIPLFGLHYDKKYFPNPQKFDPERFANKDEINVDGLYYLPFGEGPRNCIGGRFALMNLKIALGSILLNFELQRIPETPVPIVFEPKSLVAASKVGLPMRLIPLKEL